jgi:hypothetical protein
MLFLHRCRARSLRRAGYAAVPLLLCAAYSTAKYPATVDADAATRMGDALRALNQRALDRARAELHLAPGDPRRSIRLAQTELGRACLLAATAYEQRHPSDIARQMLPNQEYVDWRRRYLSTDPEHALTDAVKVARCALTRNPPARDREALLSLQAHALCFLGRHREEIAALRQAARLDPDPAFFTGRLVQAYGEVRHFRQAAALLDASGQP